MLSGDRQLGHYRLVRRIGSGGMGEVYLAEDTRISRQVAIKVVRAEAEAYPDPVAMQETVRLFQREMRAITMLDHPHILPLFDFGEEKDGTMVLTYMVMPLRQEGSLTDWLQKRGKSEKLTPDEVSHFVIQATDALQHAHDHHLIHQDIKPSNFLVRSRSGNLLPDLLLMDFGIAKMTTATATASQNIRGTPAFMAPEQWKGQPQLATDQYALAIMAYLLLTGRTPFSGRMEQIMSQHFMDQPQPPSSLNPAISPALDAVILRALEKDPGKRFPSIREFALAFQETLQSSIDQDITVIAPKKEEVSTVPNDAAVLEEKNLAVSAPLPSTGDPVQSDESVPTVTDTTIASPNSPPPPPDSIASATKKFGLLEPPILVGLVTLVILLIIAGVVGVGVYQNHANQVNASVTANNGTTSTAQANITAAAQARAYPSYLSGKGTLSFTDSLSQTNKWHASSTNSTGGACQFVDGAYHVSQQQSKYFMDCDAGGTFSNFAFEVQMTITQGDCGGMIFRDDSNGHFYYFHVCENGIYQVFKYANSSGSDITTLHSGSSSALHTGLGQGNKMAIVASGSIMTFYVNEQQIDRVQDSSYTSGLLELIAHPGFGNATDVAYSNARLWTL